MRLILTFFLVISTLGGGLWSQQRPQAILQGVIRSNRTLSADTVYLLRGFVYVKNGATLTIPPGTLIKGEKATKGSLIITRTGKINAQGTPERPIVFTSAMPPGERDYGDWGGVIILGNAPVNCPGNVCTVEGGVDNAEGDGLYGGNNPEDSSGVFRYVHIDFAGIAFQPDNEINGLTLGGVGSKTVIEYVQVSYCGDDAFEWFGGTVNCRYLVALNTWDDDFDTDFGYTGRVQYALAIRNPRIADISLSNGFETDNTKGGAAFTPFTRPIFTNVTILGPKVFSNTLNPNYQAGIHLRRNSKMNCFNSIIAGFPTCFLLDGESTEQNAQLGEALIQNNIFTSCDNYFRRVNIPNPKLNLEDWLKNNNNRYEANWQALQLQGPLYPYMPAPNVSYLNEANFNAPALNHPYFERVKFVGAFGTQDWTRPWVNWDPQNVTVSIRKDELLASKIILYPNPPNDILSVSIEQELITTLIVYNLSGQVIYQADYSLEPQALATISCESWKSGLYFVQVQGVKKLYTAKFLKK
ncbi:MAG: T9SS type A sorting domain-containing protein [Bacteroidia bacterium]|nr:T9SS type A sorting domain-containing protein [Bacteroidia bacterium]MDW8159646.1 T9SS type A sorting domain-containing protein [Bacteroidia bacterium]